MIVLLGVTAVTFTSMITGSVSGYLDTANRQNSAAVARIALDRMGRELREAMPQSVRVSLNEQCVQFLPVITSFVYTSLAAGNTDVLVIEPPGGYNPPAGNFFAAVYPINAGELYSLQAMKGVQFGLVANGLRTLTLNAPFAAPHPRSGPGQRIYIVDAPVSYCFDANTLIRSQDALTPGQPAAGALAAPALMADRVDHGASFFRNTASSWQNNALLKIVLAMRTTATQTPTSETLTLDHGVWLRNVQ